MSTNYSKVLYFLGESVDTTTGVDTKTPIKLELNKKTEIIAQALKRDANIANLVAHDTEATKELNKFAQLVDLHGYQKALSIIGKDIPYVNVEVEAIAGKLSGKALAFALIFGLYGTANADLTAAGKKIVDAEVSSLATLSNAIALDFFSSHNDVYYSTKVQDASSSALDKLLKDPERNINDWNAFMSTPTRDEADTYLTIITSDIVKYIIKNNQKMIINVLNDANSNAAKAPNWSSIAGVNDPKLVPFLTNIVKQRIGSRIISEWKQNKQNNIQTPSSRKGSVK